jgi:hypothetical protein
LTKEKRKYYIPAAENGSVYSFLKSTIGAEILGAGMQNVFHVPEYFNGSR